jgi:Na+/proline symporter
MSTHFTLLDWSIVLAMLVGTTWFGHALSGPQSTFRDFWLGGRKLPWYAVSASIVATQLSATTFITLPLMVYKTDFRYIQLAIFGQLIARFLVGYLILPRYYQHEIYSPYEFMARKLGPQVRTTTTVLFCLMAVLTRAARVYLTAVLVELLLKQPLQTFESHTGIAPIVSSMWLVGLVSMAWTLMGGINTVVWTDVILFIIFFLGAIVSLISVVHHLPGGLSELLRVGSEAGKFRLFDADPSPVKLYTIWTAVIAASVEGIAGLGTDQAITQRLLCCRNAVHARWALISSWLGISVPITCMFLGVALFAYYKAFPMTGEALAFFTAKPDRLFPIFILTELPPGLVGFIVAGVLAAAIASLESVQAALSQATLSAFYLPRRRRRLEAQGVDPDAPSEQRRTILISRGLIVVWTAVLCTAAMGVERLGFFYPAIYPTLIEMLGTFTGYIGGTLLAGFVLAVLPLRLDASGYVFAAPISVLSVFCLQWHDTWAQLAMIGASLLILTFWLLFAGPARLLTWRTPVLLVAVSLPFFLSRYGHFGVQNGKLASIAWPWFLPIGAAIATTLGVLLARPLETVAEAMPKAVKPVLLTTGDPA